MRLWRWILFLVSVSALSAWGWHQIAIDPGDVLVRIRGWQFETSLVVMVVILVLAWVFLVCVWRLLCWPFGVLSRRSRRLSQQRLGAGLKALIEERYDAAERHLNRAARLGIFRGSSLLIAAEASLRRGAYDRALEILDRAVQVAPHPSRIVRARVLRRSGKPEQAVALLALDANADILSPGGWRELVLSALACGDTTRAYDALKPLQRSGVLADDRYAELEIRVVTAVLRATPDMAALETFWSQLTRTQRRSWQMVDAYARRAAACGQVRSALDILETALRRTWTPSLVASWGALADTHSSSHLRCAEAWLKKHPDDPVLLRVMGHLCVRLQLWGKARHYLERSLALSPSAEAWESMGNNFADSGDPEQAQHCYRKALAMLSHGD